MFRYLITIQPLGFIYGSAGAFLSPENLVGRSGAKFPPDAATLSGLIFSANKGDVQVHRELKEELYVAGPFWAFVGSEENFYVPLPRHKIITEDGFDEWAIRKNQWILRSELDGKVTSNEEKKDESEYRWLRIDRWDDTPEVIYNSREGTHEAHPPIAKNCWEYIPILHPKLRESERHVLPEDGLFLENAVQMKEDTCLVYLSTYNLMDGWYQFGGEGHMVEVKCIELRTKSLILDQLQKRIKKSFALIAPGVWGSNQLSHRYPKQDGFAQNNNKLALLTEKAVPYRYRIGYGEKEEKKQKNFRERHAGRLSRGRYAVPAGSVYVLREALNRTWWEFDKEWFPEKGFLKKLGCGLCLPIQIEGVDE